MDYTITPASPEDGLRIAALQVLTWRETYRGLLPDPVLDRMNETRLGGRWTVEILRLDDDFDAQVLVAQDPASNAIGFASCGAVRDRRAPFEGEISMLYVRRSAQGAGAGTGLLRACMRHLASRGIFRVGLWVVTGNLHARRFYEHLGGRQAGKREDRLDGHSVPVLAYVWDDLSQLAASEA